MRKAVFVKHLWTWEGKMPFPGDYDSHMQGEDGTFYTVDPTTPPEFLIEHCSPGSLVVLQSTRQFTKYLKLERKNGNDIPKEEFRIWKVLSLEAS